MTQIRTYFDMILILIADIILL